VPCTYEELRAEFRWNVPPQYNIGVDCSDAQPPASIALILGMADGSDREITFGEVARLSNRFANALAGLGVRRHDRVAVVLPQGLETALTHLATYKLGGVAIPLSSLFGPDALGYRLADAGACAVVTDATGVERLEDLDLPALRHVVLVGEGGSGGRVSRFDDLLAAASDRFVAADTAADDPALLIYTSGTTGPPKGALHAHRVLLGHLPGFELSHNTFPMPDDLFWTPADWAWIGGLMDALLPSWHHGVAVLAAPRAGLDP